jgi:hypothetical protein
VVDTADPGDEPLSLSLHSQEMGSKLKRLFCSFDGRDEKQMA